MKLYVGNLSFHTTAEDLQAAFQAFGTVSDVALITDRDTGHSRGFAFVTMANRAETEIVTEGAITAVLPGTMFRVELNERHVVLAHISGKMRKRFIRLNRGDRVRPELSPYDLTKARIVYRLK